MIDRQALAQGARDLGVGLEPEQLERLLAFGALIVKWGKVYNLTALRDPTTVLTHHLLDSLAVVAPLRRVMPRAATLLDVGSGAGLPGAVIAIVQPSVEVCCVDAVAKKAAFVQQVAAELGVPNLRAVHGRVESLTGSYDVVCARAFASLADFTTLSAHLLAPAGIWMALKGQVPVQELAVLPREVDVFHVEQLAVPGLDAERCIVWSRRRGP